MKLSERIDDMRQTGMHGAKMFNLLDECYALARRVEGAAKVKVRGKVGEVCTVAISHDYCGQRVALVPVEGGSDVH